MLKFFRFGVILCLFAFSCGIVSAQQTLGSINGTAKDNSGGTVSGVTVKVRDLGTNYTRTAIAKEDGSFSIEDLPIGTYEVTFSQDGFETEVHSRIMVQGNRATTVNSAQVPGKISSTVTVTATPLLNQTDTTNGYTLGSELIESLPLGTGSFTQLAILAPGVNADFLSGAGTNAGLGNQNIFANGQRDTSNVFSFNSVDSVNLFNGLSSSSISEGRFVLNTNEQFGAGGSIQTNTSVFDAIGQGLPAPPPETIEEINVNTSLYGVSQGTGSGAHISTQTKSGTNDLHGTIYEYHQTDAWDANQFFFNAAGISRPPLHRNSFGATLGGPIIHDKLFFFASYQGQRVSDATNGSTEVVNVPTGLTDDRSAATLSGLAGVPTGSVDSAALKLLQAKTAGGQLIVPSATITDPATIQSLGGNAIVTGPASTFNADQVNANIDYLFGTKDRLAGKYYFQNDPSTNPFAVSKVPGFGQTLQAGSQVFSLENTTSLTSNSTWEQRIGFIRQIANAHSLQPLSATALGVNLLGSDFFPGFTIRNAGSGTGGSLGIGPTSNFANAGVFQNHYQVGSTYNWRVGRHSLSFGFTGDYGQLNVLNRENEVATFNFTNFANFLTGTLGSRNGGQILNGETNRYFRARQVGLFAQDSFKLKPNLTVTAGLRWDWDGPLSEKNGLLTNFYSGNYSYDLGTDTINDIGLVIARNNKQFCSTPSVFCAKNDSTLTGRQWLFEPRIGVAWSPGFAKNLVIRAGYGLYADRGEFFTEFSPSAGLGISGPFGVTTEQPFTVPANTTCLGAQCLSNNPFGTSPLTPPPNNLSGVAALVHNQSGLSGCAEPVTPTCTPTGTPLSAFLFGGYDPRNTLPYSENWTLDLQWQPYNSLLIDVGYVGNHGQHELLPIPFNQSDIATPNHPINGQIFSYGFQATDANGGPGVLLTEQVGTTIGEFTGADGNTALRVPFIGYNPNSDFWEAEGVSNYQALQISAKKLMSHGLMINASYTWSRTLDEGSGLSEGLFFNGNNPLNASSAYGNAAFDRTHVFTVNYTYQIPSLAKSQGLLQYAVNGWSVSGLTIAESGLPYSVYDFSGTVASQFFGAGDDFITNPLLGIPGGTSKSVQLQGTTGVNAGQPVLNANAFGITVNAPGTNGVPDCGPTTDNPSPTAACDFSETGFSNTGRNTFRGPLQVRFDFAVSKSFKINERFTLRYDAQFFNLFNHPSLDAPTNNISLNPCFGPNLQTSPANGCQWLGTIPAVGSLTSPIANGTGMQAAPAGSGFIQGTLGSPRLIQMALHLTF
jgi:Carboxypeptidase regulatory-like domain